MISGKRYFSIGLGTGAVLSLVAVQLWGYFMVRTIADNSQPVLLRPFTQARPQLGSDSSFLPKPWFPQDESRADQDWKLEALDGQTTALGDFRGKVLFLNFWSTTCLPCIEEMPGIAKLRASVNNPQIAFALVTEDDRSQVQSFLRKNRIDLPIYFASSKHPQYLSVDALPTTYVLNSNGSLVFKHVGALNWDNYESRAYLNGLARIR